MLCIGFPKSIHLITKSLYSLVFCKPSMPLLNCYNIQYIMEYSYNHFQCSYLLILTLVLVLGLCQLIDYYSLCASNFLPLHAYYSLIGCQTLWIHLLGCWICLYSYEYSWVFFLDTVKLLGNSLIFSYLPFMLIRRKPGNI